MIIRQATIKDALGIRHLCKAWYKDNRQGVDTLKEVRRNVRNERAFVAVDEDNRIIGYTMFSVKQACKNESFTTRKGQWYLEVDSLYVDRAHRDEHIGTSLLKAVENYAYENKIKVLYLYASGADEIDRLTEFYQDKGFKKSKMVMYKKLAA